MFELAAGLRVGASQPPRTMPQIPGLGENSFLVTKGFDAMKSAIARKAERVLERLADGSLPVHADEL